MGLSCFPEFNQSITLSILCYLPPELPPYQLGKLENKTLFLYINSIRITGYPLITPKDGKERIFQGFLSADYRRNLDNYLIYALLVVPSTKSNLLFSLKLIIPVHEFFTNTYTLHEMFR